jgi:serine phosphatase RsbU (regulator of sigma subunit)/pSer/pThr/pTyr-binding forkhead associated (FHA) protein
MPSLRLLTGAHEGRLLPLRGDRTVLGRDAACDVVITEATVRCDSGVSRMTSVSRRHAVILCVEDKYYIEDGDGQGGKSRNGTFVNDQRVPFPGRVLLHHDDRIRICDFRCAFQEGTEGTFAVEASLDHESSVQSLQAQPAEKLQAILAISNSLSTMLDIDALLPRIVDHLLQLFKQADRGFIILWDEASRRLVPRVCKTRAGDADDRFSDSVIWQCVENVRAILGNDLAQQFPESHTLSLLPIRSLMCAPLWSPDGKPLGAIQLDTQGPQTKFTQEDLNLLLGIASQASIALCNARLHRSALQLQRREQDLELARQVQRALLPQCLPDVPGYEFDAYYEPAQEVGGDYYDFIPLPRQRLGILLGDVAGKGVAAALVMVKFSVEARVCLLSEPDLPAGVNKLNTIMNQAVLADRFVTLIAVVLDPATHTVMLLNAGHPSPLLSRSATGAVEEAAPRTVAGLPLGIAAEADYRSCQIELGPGDGLALFSDGVTEARNARGQQFGMKGARAVLGPSPFSARLTGKRLLEAVKQHTGGGPQDDITLVCFGRARG